MKVLIDRDLTDLGDFYRDGMTGVEFRQLLRVPDDRDLWRRADYQYREYLKGLMTMDEKVNDDGRVFLGVAGVVAFFTAPKYINGSTHRATREYNVEKGSGRDAD